MPLLDRHVFLLTEGQTQSLETLCIRLGCNKQTVQRIALERLAKSLNIDFPRDEPPVGKGKLGVTKNR